MRFELSEEDLQTLSRVQHQISFDTDCDFVSARLFNKFTKVLLKMREQIPTEDIQTRRIRTHGK